jgi:hypothetical protein
VTYGDKRPFMPVPHAPQKNVGLLNCPVILNPRCKSAQNAKAKSRFAWDDGLV